MGLDNRFLESLPPEEIARLEPALRRLTLARDQLIAESGHPVPHAVFPVDCVISVVAVMHDGRQVESRTIGRESAYGLLHALGSRHSYERVTAQIGGEAWRLPIETLAAAAADSPALVRRIVQRAQATLVQTAQSTACNSLHTADQRLCRWLLLTRDRLASDVLPLTQEHLAIMLGVQRTTVTAVASALQSSGAIAYSRGRITVLDAEILRQRSCECYQAIEEAASRLLADGGA